MKKSTLKTLLLTSIIFLIIIAIIIFIYEARVQALEDSKERMVTRIEAIEDIAPGSELTDGKDENGNTIPGVTPNIKRVQVQDVLKTEGLLYKMSATETFDEEGNKTANKELLNDGRWADGKIATQQIYKNEWISSKKVATKDEYYDYNERLYAVPFDADTTGGFNVEKGEYVDIAVRYKTDVNVDDYKLNSTVRKIYQSLKPNQITDIVLSKRLIEDIRDETGTSITENSATKPGYICFRLTYDEINKLEWAKECGTIYIGKSRDYSEAPYTETFMQGIELPSIGLQTNLPSQDQ